MANSGLGDSILATIKKMLGLEDNYSPFDSEIIVYINSALMTLQQLNVGPKEGFAIKDYSEKWSDFLTNAVNLNGVQQYIAYRVRIGFDPPNNASVLSSLKEQCAELEWRLNVQSESVEEFDFVKDDTYLSRKH